MGLDSKVGRVGAQAQTKALNRGVWAPRALARLCRAALLIAGERGAHSGDRFRQQPPQRSQRDRRDDTFAGNADGCSTLWKFGAMIEAQPKTLEQIARKL